MRRGAIVACAVGVSAATGVASTAAAEQGSRFRPAKTGQLGVVATESREAALVGRQVLERGGNAVDAAAATVFAVGVARPQSCGIGGGGFLVYRSRRRGADSLDFRETAPAAIRPDTFAGPGPHQQFVGHTTVGVPGTVAGMAAALRRYGTMSLRQAIAPAERLARRGFRIQESFSRAATENARRLATFPAARQKFLQPDGTALEPGTILRQPEHAASLRRIMRGGARAFYRGTIARRIVRDMQAPRPQTNDPGLLTLEDFARYRAIWRKPLRGTYRGRSIIAMPPPTSGGIAILQMLNILETFDVARFGPSSADFLHVLAEAQRIAFADRAQYVADPDQVRVPTEALISKTYAAGRASSIDMARTQAYQPGLGPRPGSSTTHVSVIDRRGNSVAVTCTIEQEFGSTVIAPGTGFLLNNQLTDFGAAGTANEAAPGKRPRSSMSPTIVVEPSGRPSAVIGGAGGARIIMGVLQPIVQMIDFNRPLDLALDAERIEAGGRALVVEEARIPAPVLDDLRRRGHTIQGEGEYGVRPRVNAAGTTLRGNAAASDPRTDDGALAERPR